MMLLAAVEMRLLYKAQNALLYMNNSSLFMYLFYSVMIAIVYSLHLPILEFLCYTFPYNYLINMAVCKDFSFVRMVFDSACQLRNATLEEKL